ncbi:MAG: hypothetical protein J5I47_02965 [Vicingus serpentipes]|nr:hypothetical protein [Vicingus serpentipes]
MSTNATEDYIHLITNVIYAHTKYFEMDIDKWEFMIVSQPKIPFSNEPKVPNITHTYNLNNEDLAKRIVNAVHNNLYGIPYEMKENDNGNYLICFYR